MAKDIKEYLNKADIGVVNYDPYAWSIDELPSISRNFSISAKGDGNFQGSPATWEMVNSPGSQGGTAGYGMRWGWVSPIGNRIEVDDTPGSETVRIEHHTGATIGIEADGSIFVNPSSRRGLAMKSPRGDAAMSAVGIITIDGKGEVNIQTNGDLNLNAGGNINLNAKGAIVNNSRTWEQHVEGSMLTDIVEDHSLMIGGLSRETIAGDRRLQVTGNNTVDVGSNISLRAKASITNDVENGNYKVVVSGDIQMGAGNDAFFNAASQMYLRASRIDLNDASVSVDTPKSTEVVGADTIINSMTTRLEDPLYPDNALLQHADLAAIRKQE